MANHPKKRICREVEGNVHCDQCPGSFGNLTGLNIHRGMMHKNGYQLKRRRNGSGEFVQQDAAAGISIDGGVDQDHW